uniref:Pseudouridine synthase I TruA alpha/beta domain-containing protein n=1 Tax=Vitrella brassicaformis TaxID=1169539 RepID=A0A7S1KF28_9ALVE|mmetsp:Transcript_51588/g.129593  ORF Transcript_51588/g.129593 Transcript_51588/m.129593 type:complete len:507 (+) Transcript_51588:32-1552(+)
MDKAEGSCNSTDPHELPQVASGSRRAAKRGKYPRAKRTPWWMKKKQEERMKRKANSGGDEPQADQEEEQQKEEDGPPSKRQKKWQGFQKVEVGPSRPRWRKFPMALVLGYVGTEYHGLQKQVDASTNTERVRTIEGVLEKCLHECEGIADDDFGYLQKIKWTRVGRTDKGVHAACQVVGLLLRLPLTDEEKAERDERYRKHKELADGVSDERTKNGGDGQVDEQAEPEEEQNESNETKMARIAVRKELFLKRLNDKLPPDMKALGLFKVTKGFDARVQCLRRRYMYVFPGYALAPVTVKSTYRAAYEGTGDLPAAQNDLDDAQDETEDSYKPPVWIDNTQENFEPTDEDVARFERIMKEYEGTHDFYNFTSRIEASDPSTKRYIEKISVHRETIEGQSFLCVTLVGQSFLLNQIRKLIGLALEVIRGSAASDSIRLSLSTKTKMFIHLAPGEGLFLERAFYEGYNRRLVGEGTSEPVQWENLEPAIEAFKRDTIFKEIAKAARDGA